MATHFLYLTNATLASLVVRGGHVAERREFATTDEGLAAFEPHLRALRALPTHLICDLAEEDFRHDTIPHVGRSDREAIVQRKVAQMFRNTPFRYAHLQGREGEGRRDDRVLYTAITNPEALRPWLDLIERLAVPLRGIHSAALLGSRLLAALDLRAPHTLLVLFTPGEAVRQTYFRKEELQFTRLAPLDLEEGRTLGALLAEETTRTWQYLDNLRYFAPEDRLEVCVLASAADRPAIEPALREFPQIHYRVIDIGEASAKLGLKGGASSSSVADAILVRAFLRRPMENHFASEAERRHSTLRTARLVLDRAALGVLAASIAIGGWNLSRAFRAGDADQRTGREIAALNQEYARIQSSMPAPGSPVATVRDAVAFHDAYIERFPSIGQFLAPLSSVLEAHPQVRLAQLAWLVTDDAAATPALASAPARSPPPVKSLPKGGENAVRPAVDENAASIFPTARFEVALIEATVEVASHDFRGALGEVEQLASAIARLPGFRAQVVESPLDVRPSLVLQGRHAEREANRMAPRFILRVVRERRA